MLKGLHGITIPFIPGALIRGVKRDHRFNHMRRFPGTGHHAWLRNTHVSLLNSIMLLMFMPCICLIPLTLDAVWDR